MSYTIDIVVPSVPEDKELAWDFVLALRARDEEIDMKAQALVALHSALTGVYPCLSSYSPDDPAVESCAWSDGPMISNFGSEMGMLGLRTGDDFDDVLQFVIQVATHLGMTVFDEQAGAIHRPRSNPSDISYYVVVRGIREGFTKDQVVHALMAMFKRDEAQVRAIFDVKFAYVRKGIDLVAAIVYQAALHKAGCACAIGPGKTHDEPERHRTSAEYSKMSMASLHQAASNGDSRAVYYIGWRHYCGAGVPRDLALAAQWYEKAAKLGDVFAQLDLGRSYWEGTGVAVNYAAALEWTIKAAEQGHITAMSNLGSMYSGGEVAETADPDKSFFWYRKAAEQGNANCQYHVGHALLLGLQVAQDKSLAIAWFKQAAEQGHVEAQYSLGVIYDKGNGVPRDDALAVEYYSKAAAQGKALAQFNLAICYNEGQGVARDVVRSIAFCRQAADQGDATAQYWMGRRFELGDGVPEDLDQAFAWFRKAAELGNAKAQFSLAEMYVQLHRHGDPVETMKQHNF